MSSPLADSAMAAAQHPQMQRAVLRGTPKAQADIAAGRAAPTGLEVAMQEVDRVIDDGAREMRDTPAVREMGSPAEGASFDASFRAAREAMARNNAIAKLTDEAVAREECLGALERDAEFSRAAKDPGAIVLTGAEADRYRALQRAANIAHETARAAKMAGDTLREAFQQVVNALTTKET